MELTPLSLYVHLPWCVRKCPYCDFNSHAIKGDLPESDYVSALISDLEQELPLVWGRTVHSIFFGGGTPSLFTAGAIGTLVDGFRRMLRVSPEAEITLEANPGTIEHDSFAAYRDAGVNRISLGVQSFDDAMLAAIGRIHGRSEIEQAVESIQAAGIVNFNLDLMYALPGQTVSGALQDLQAALSCSPAHVSHYQLTIEPNTAFHRDPPDLPDHDGAWEIQDACGRLLCDAGYHCYEVSAWSRSGYECRHNLNYWKFGDYIGIGAGAHGKVTLPAENAVRRRIRHRHPAAWMRGVAQGEPVAQDRVLDEGELIFDYFLNQLRLRDGVVKKHFSARTGLAWGAVSGPVERALDRGLLEDCGDALKPTDLGWRFVNETQALFLP